MEKPGKKTVEELRQALEELGLDSRGRKPELKLRLKKAQKKQANQTPKEDKEDKEEKEEKEIRQQEFDYFLFFDVEATCIKDGGFNYANEIIEFPIVLVDGTTFDIVDEFRSYVKPGINPILSEFCIELTGITQATVDQSPDFVQVLNEFQVFMAKYDLFRSKTATFVTGKIIQYNII
jgi:3'-5' exoribonuclease 1